MAWAAIQGSGAVTLRGRRANAEVGSPDLARLLMTLGMVLVAGVILLLLLLRAGGP